MNQVDKIIDKYVQINEINWKNVGSAAKTAGGHALDIATGGISSAVKDTIDAARGKDTGAQVDQMQQQVDQQAADAKQQASQEADIDATQQAEIQQAQRAADSLDATQEQEIDANIQKIAALDQRLSNVEQIIQQVQSNTGNQPR